MSYSMQIAGLGELKDTGTVGTWMSAGDVFVYHFDLSGVRLRTVDDVKELVRAVGGGSHNMNLLGWNIWEQDVCGVAVSSVGPKQTDPVRVQVVYKDHSAGDSSGLALGVTVADIQKHAQKVLRQTWPGATISNANMARIVNNDGAKAWWNQQPAMWVTNASKEDPNLVGARTAAFGYPTPGQMIVGDADSPALGVPVDMAFRSSSGGAATAGGGSGGSTSGGAAGGSPVVRPAGAQQQESGISTTMMLGVGGAVVALGALVFFTRKRPSGEAK